MQLIRKIWISTTQRVMLITVLGMVISLLLDMLVAYKLGAGVVADALIVALTVPLFMDTIIREGNKSTLIPILLRMNQDNGDAETYLFLSKFINSSIVLSSLLVIVIMVFSESVIDLIAPGLEVEYSRNAANFLCSLSVVVLFSSVITIVNTLNNIRHRFLLLAARNIVIPTVVILCFLLGWDSGELSSYIVIGYVLGFLLYAISVVMYAYGDGFRYNFVFLKSSDYKLLATSSVVITFGFIINQAVRLFERSLATTISAGALSAYYFAFRLFNAGHSIIASSVLLTTLPALSKSVADRDLKEFSRLLYSRLSFVVIMSALVASLFMLFSAEIIEIIYFRGEFSLEALSLASAVLFWLGIVLVFQCVIIVLQGGLFALKGYGSILTTIIVYATIVVITAPYLVKVYGIEGIPISLAIASFVNILVILSFIVLNLRKVRNG